jgi:hypothetical protein
MTCHLLCREPDFVFKISSSPAQKSVDAAVEAKVFGRWRRGLQEKMKTTSRNFYVPQAQNKLLSDVGADIVLALGGDLPF